MRRYVTRFSSWMMDQILLRRFAYFSSWMIVKMLLWHFNHMTWMCNVKPSSSWKMDWTSLRCFEFYDMNMHCWFYLFLTDQMLPWCKLRTHIVECLSTYSPDQIPRACPPALRSAHSFLCATTKYLASFVVTTITSTPHRHHIDDITLHQHHIVPHQHHIDTTSMTSHCINITSHWHHIDDSTSHQHHIDETTPHQLHKNINRSKLHESIFFRIGLGGSSCCEKSSLGNRLTHALLALLACLCFLFAGASRRAATRRAIHFHFWLGNT